MENFIKYFSIALLGLVLHILGKITEENKNPNFTLSGFVKSNIYHTLTSVLSIFALVYLAITDELMKSYLPMTPVISFMVGYFSQSIFKTFIFRFKPKQANEESGKNTPGNSDNNA